MAKKEKEVIGQAVTVVQEMDIKEAKGLVVKMEKAVESVDIGDGLAVKQLADSIKKVKTFVTQKQNKYILPAKEIIAEAKETYDPYLEACSKAEKTLKERVTAHVMEQRRLEEIERKKIADKAEADRKKIEADLAAGKIDEAKAEQKLEKAQDKAVEKMETVQETKKSIGGIKTRMVKDYRIVDESKIPDKYWTREINRGLLRWEALSEGIGFKVENGQFISNIPGIEIFEKPQGSF